MIRSFTHKGLRRLFEQGDASKIRADQVARVADVLAMLNRAQTARDLDLPGYRLHALKGDLKGYWSMTISGNRRIVFRIENGEALEIDLVDYH